MALRSAIHRTHAKGGTIVEKFFFSVFHSIAHLLIFGQCRCPNGQPGYLLYLFVHNYPIPNNHHLQEGQSCWYCQTFLKFTRKKCKRALLRLAGRTVIMGNNLKGMCQKKFHRVQKKVNVQLNVCQNVYRFSNWFAFSA